MPVGMADPAPSDNNPVILRPAHPAVGISAALVYQRAVIPMPGKDHPGQAGFECDSRKRPPCSIRIIFFHHRPAQITHHSADFRDVLLGLHHNCRATHAA